jgi:hypothetical protein
VKTIELTQSEVAASDGFLCWRSRRGKACSREFAHDNPISQCRYDMTIKTEWTLRTWAFALGGSVIGGLLGLAGLALLR